MWSDVRFIMVLFALAADTTSVLVSLQLTVQLVDSFVVPKMSPVPHKHDPIITQEDLQRVPDTMAKIREGLMAGPKATAQMPKAAWEMVARQLPDSHQAFFQKLSKFQSSFGVKLSTQPLEG